MRITSIPRRGDGKNPNEGTHCLLLRACTLFSLTGIVLPRRPLPLLKLYPRRPARRRVTRGTRFWETRPPSPATPLSSRRRRSPDMLACPAKCTRSSARSEPTTWTCRAVSRELDANKGEIAVQEVGQEWLHALSLYTLFQTNLSHTSEVSAGR